MSSVLAVAAIAVVVLLPGYALLPSNCPRRLRLPFVVFASVAVTSLLALLLAACGLFNTVLVAALEVPLLLLRWRSGDWPRLELAAHLPAALVLAALVCFAVLTAGEPFDATGDAGVYTISAGHLASTGSWTWPLDDVVPDTIARDLVIYRRPYVRPWWEVAPGFIVRGEQVVPQFFPLYAVWGAVFAAALGIRGVLAANLLGAAMTLLACDALFRLLAGRVWGRAGVALVVLNPVFLIFLKYPSAEAFLGGLLAGWLLWMVLFLRAPSVGRSVMPAALLALGVLTKFFAWAVTGAVALVLLMLPWRKLRVAAAFPLLVLPAAAVGAVAAAAHLDNHIGQLLILSGFKIVAVCCVLVMLLRLVWSKVAPYAPLALGVVYAMALVFLWWSSDNGQVQDVAVLVGHPTLVGATIGLLLYLWRRRSLSLALPAFVFVLLSLYLYLGSGDSPFYPFAARRYLPVTVPLGGLFLAYLARSIGRAVRHLPRPLHAAAPALAMVVIMVGIVPPLGSQWSAVVVRQGHGFLETLSELEELIPDHQVVLAVGNGWRYAPHMLLLDDRPVYCLEPGQWGVLPRIDDFFEKHPGALVLGDEPRHAGVIGTVEERRQVIAISSSPPLKEGPPRGSTFRLFAVTQRDWVARGVLDVGTDDQLLVAGCYRAERTQDRSFRWTGPRAEILADGARELRFVWSAGANPNQPLRPGVFVRGAHVGDGDAGSGWTASRWFPIPDGNGPALVEIRIPTFQPARVGLGEDRRHLGVRLDRVEAR